MSNVDVPADPLSRLSAALAPRYQIERELGVGGMSTVYLARDVRHERSVAIKILRPELAAAVGAERFLSEIRTTAHLQHARILGLIDSGEVDGAAFYVMPFVAGESLRERLARETQLPIADAVRIATDVAGALDYAHRQKVVHRDIKPANILLHEGHAYIADFGIALAVTLAGRGDRLTEHGMSLGTPEYMSPEQAMGERHLDGRADIYALGCMTYEMLAGEPPFTGPSSQAVIAKVMTAEPVRLSALRRSVPENVAAATMTALRKVPADRFASAAEFATALNDPRYVGHEPRAARAGPTFRKRDIVGGSLIAALAVAAIVAWFRPAVETHDQVTRFELVVPDSMFSPQVVLSRDGRRLLWSNQSGYFERPLDSIAIRRLRDGTPDTPTLRDLSSSGSEALVSGRGRLAIASLAGGPPRALVAGGARGGVWGNDDFIYFSIADSGGRTHWIARVPTRGGATDTIARVDGTPTALLPLATDRGLILTLARGAASDLSVLDFRSRSVRSLGVSGTRPQFVDPGWLIFTNGISILAAPFDTRGLTLTRPPIVVGSIASGATILSARGSALLTSLPPDQNASGIVIRTQNGVTRTLPNVPDTIRFGEFALSPDGARLAVTGFSRFGGPPVAGPPISNIYIYELSSSRMTRLGSAARDQAPSWLPKGDRLSFVRVSTDTPTVSTLFTRPWDGSSVPVPIVSRPGGGRGGVLGPVTWLPDGRQGVLRVANATTVGGAAPSGDLMRLSLGVSARLDTAFATEYAESEPTLTRDGRLLAFTSDQSGRSEVYVRPFAGGEVRGVSFGGGTRPRWAHNDNELFYVNGDTLFAARIRSGADISPGNVRVVFIARNIGQGYAVLPGDTSFVTAAPPPGNRFVMTLNFGNELERLLTKR